MKTNSVRKKLDGERNMKDIDPYSLAERASTVLADETGIVDHDIALVLGSGWASAIDEIGDIFS